MTQVGYLDGQNCDKSENQVCVNGFKIFKHRKNYFRYRENNFFDVVGS